MGTVNADIVARLQLRADQFSSETGQRFAELKTRAQSAASEIRSSFSSSFAEVQRLAQTALTLPRTKAGGLDLSSEIEQLTRAAAQADRQSEALRQLSIAQTGAAAAGRADAEALKQEADASAVGALAAERDAQAIRERISALQAVQAELNRTAVGTTNVTKAQQAYVVSAGQQRASAISLGQQFTDFAVQVQGGQSAFTAFAQQAPQAALALNGFEGKLGAVGRVLIGPWGVAATIGVAVLAPLVGKIIEGNNALDDATDKLKKDAEASEVNRRAKEKFAHTIEGVTAAIHDQRAAQEKANDAERTAAEQDNINAKKNQRRLAQIREETVALLQRAKAAQLVLSGPGISSERGIGVAQSAAREQAALLQAEIDQNQKLAVEAKKALDESRRDLAVEQGKALADPIKQLNKQYDDQIRKAHDIATAEEVVNGTLARRVNIIEQNRKAAVQAEQDRQSAARSAARSAANAGPLTDFISPVAGARTTGIFGETRPGHQHAGIDLAVPVGTPVRAPAGGAVDFAGVRSGYGNVIVINFGAGTTGRFGHLSRFNVKPGDTVNAGDIIGYTGGERGAEGAGDSTGPHLHYEVRRNGKAVDPRTGRFPTDSVAAGDDAARKAKEAADQAESLANIGQRAGQAIANINAQWDEQPRLIDRARLQTADLEELIAKLAKEKPPGFEQLIADAIRAEQIIQDGLDRPFRDFVKSQREGLAVQQLTLQGRDAEATSLQNALQIQRQQGEITDGQLAAVQQLAEQQERISEALEDQRRIVSIYTGAVGDLQRGFEQFLGDLRSKPGDALKNYVNNFVGTFTHLGDQLLTNALFGGIDRDVEKYVRKLTGQRTPAEILTDQADEAGAALSNSVTTTRGALDDLVGAVRAAAADLRTAGGAAPATGLSLPAAGGTAGDGAEFGSRWVKELLNTARTDNVAANDNLSITKVPDQIAKQSLSLAGVFGTGIDRFVKNLDGLGIKLPNSITGALKKGLPTVLQGISAGQLGGSIFSAISGKGSNPLASGLGGIIGDVAGKALGKAASGVLGKAAGLLGPIGGVLGGVLGDLVGGLFAPTPKSSAGIAIDPYGTFKSANASGTTQELKSGAATLAGAVSSALQQIADQLGAKVTGATDVKIGTYKGELRVNDHGGAIGGVTGSGAISFATEQDAVAYAVTAALQDGVLSGISKASLKILQSGQDLQRALTKALSIEAIPKDLKAQLDPVQAAIDALNEKWRKTVDALKEGGATAEQFAQAQQLYNIQLADTKNSTATASQALKDFITSLKVGSNSPYSLRDQEATARAQLQPFLTQIASGDRIDQAKYQAAAQSFLDIERQLYGSTKDYFDALDLIQGATNKAIEAIDNVKSASPDVANPFAEATAANTAATATSAKATAGGIATGNEIAAQTSSLIARNNDLMEQLVDLMSNRDLVDFIGISRNFVSGKAA